MRVVTANDDIPTEREKQWKMGVLPEQIPACEKPSCDAKEPNPGAEKETRKREKKNYWNVLDIMLYIMEETPHWLVSLDFIGLPTRLELSTL